MAADAGKAVENRKLKSPFFRQFGFARSNLFQVADMFF
jgi:hypothetical protein